MSNVSINVSGQDVSAIETGSNSGKQQMVFGNDGYDLVLKTLSKIQVQVGGKFYDLPFNTDGDTIAVDSNAVTIVSKLSDLGLNSYPGEGKFVFTTTDNILYLTSASTYIPLNKTTSSSGGDTGTTTGLFISYDTVQDLSGIQKAKALANIGYFIGSIKDVVGLSVSEVYADMVVYAVAEARHYKLTDINNFTLTSSWTELYLNLTDGGLVKNKVQVALDKSTGSTKASLHVEGEYNSTDLTQDFPGFTLGKRDLSSGLAVWSNEGVVYLKSLDTDSLSGFLFVTRGSDGTEYQPLSITKNNVGIGGAIDYNYGVTVTPTIIFKNAVTLSSKMGSSDFSTGRNGTGFSLYKDSSNYWSLEVDKILVRRSADTPAGKYETRGLNGSLIYNNSLTVTAAYAIDEIPIFVKASVAGKYDSSHVIKPLSARASQVKVVRTTPSALETSGAVKTLDTITLAYGIGDINSDGSSDTSLTYNRHSDLSYYSVIGTHEYDPATLTYVPTPGGSLVQISKINVYLVQFNATVNVGDLLYYKVWDNDKNFLSSIQVEVVAIYGDDVYVYIYEGMTLAVDVQLVHIGNTNATGALMYSTSSEITNPYLAVLSNINSFNELYYTYYYYDGSDYDDGVQVEDVNSESTNIRVKIGDISNIVDPDLNLAAGQKGIYSDNAYMKGGFVANRLKVNDITTVSTIDTIVMCNTDGRLLKMNIAPRVANWDAAYSWGNHALAGYAKQVDLATETTNRQTADTTNLAAAKTYADSGDATTLASAKAYTDTSLGTAKAYTDTKVAALVNSSPAALDTLKELADALGDDPNYAATTAAAIGLKAAKTDVDAKNATQDTAIGLKADKTYVDSQDALKADKTYVDSQNTTQNTAIGLKADKTYVDSQDSAEVTARTTGDTNTLASAKTYADGKVANLVANTRSITATGSGISGGGDLTADRTISLDFTYLNSQYRTTSTDIEITDATKGYILKSPNGTRFRLTIDDSGVLTTTSL